jgi:hypothetical protein
MKPVISIPILTVALVTVSAALSSAVACIPPAGGCCTETENGKGYTCKVTICSIGGHLDRKEHCYHKVPGAGLSVQPHRPIPHQ